MLQIFLRDQEAERIALEPLRGVLVGDPQIDVADAFEIDHGGLRDLVITGTAKQELDKIRARLAERVGPERAHRIADYSRNLFIFPNLLAIRRAIRPRRRRARLARSV